jgi:hypothetical protein
MILNPRNPLRNLMLTDISRILTQKLLRLDLNLALHLETSYFLIMKMMAMYLLILVMLLGMIICMIIVYRVILQNQPHLRSLSITRIVLDPGRKNIIVIGRRNNIVIIVIVLLMIVMGALVVLLPLLHPHLILGNQNLVYLVLHLQSLAILPVLRLKVIVVILMTVMVGVVVVVVTLHILKVNLILMMMMILLDYLDFYLNRHIHAPGGNSSHHSSRHSSRSNYSGRERSSTPQPASNNQTSTRTTQTPTTL